MGERSRLGVGYTSGKFIIHSLRILFVRYRGDFLPIPLFFVECGLLILEFSFSLVFEGRGILSNVASSRGFL